MTMPTVSKHAQKTERIAVEGTYYTASLLATDGVFTAASVSEHADGFAVSNAHYVSNPLGQVRPEGLDDLIEVLSELRAAAAQAGIDLGGRQTEEEERDEALAEAVSNA